MPTTTLFTNYVTKNVGIAPATVITPAATAGAQTTLTGMSLANTTQSPVTASVYITRSGVDYYIVKGATVPAGGTMTVAGWDQKIVLIAGDVVKAQSSANTSIDIMAAALVVDGAAGTGGGVITASSPLISTASASAVTFTTGAEVTNIEDIEFSTDGTKMYLLNRTTTVLLQYTLSTAWNVSTAVYASKTLNMTAQLGTGRQASFIFNTDGTSIYAIDITGKVIYQYGLTIAWDISTASYASKSFNVATATTFPVGLAASTDGLSFYTCDPISDKVDRYLLSSPWDISTATLTGRTSYVTTTNAGAPQGVDFYDSTSMYVTDQSLKIVQYRLTTPWDVTTAVFVGFKASWLGSDTVFSSDGTKAFPIGGANLITQWNVTVS